VRASDAAGVKRSKVFAAHPGEPLLSFNMVTSLMPLASASAPQTYKFALAIGLAVPIIASLFGLLPFALAAAAFVVPIVYILYLYDVSQWEDEPVPVLLGCVGIAAVLSVLFTWLWRDGILGGGVAFVSRKGHASVDTKTLLVVGLLVPIVGEVLKQVGPLWLATKARFDDLLDGLTFGVASGATFAALETILVNRQLIFSGQTHYNNVDPAVWISLVVVAGLLKPVIYGAATGIAVAQFSGLGEGHDGFKAKYFQGLLEALLANVAFQMGIYLLGRSGGTVGIALGLVWALIVAMAVVLRLRVLLHTALLEEGLEHAQNGTVPGTATQDVAFCPECEMPLLHNASFCSTCGASVKAGSKTARRANSEPSAPPSDAPATEEAPV
jgi:RsiW-degrading membrane proteinase PrsW (M82 family)